MSVIAGGVVFVVDTVRPLVVGDRRVVHGVMLMVPVATLLVACRTGRTPVGERVGPDLVSVGRVGRLEPLPDSTPFVGGETIV